MKSAEFYDKLRDLGVTEETVQALIRELPESQLEHVACAIDQVKRLAGLMVFANANELAGEHSDDYPTIMADELAEYRSEWEAAHPCYWLKGDRDDG